MFHSLRVQGQTGRIRVGYQTAATLGPYTLTPAGQETWEVSAAVQTADAFWLTQAPRVLELAVGQQRWRWPADGLMVASGTVTGTVTGRPERR